MEITYQHANPYAGNESFVLRIREKHEERTPCVLVDAGDGVDVDDLLGEAEYLAAILLTHAHVDHYCSLDDAHRDGAPILTSPGTAAMLEDVFTEGKRHYGLSGTDALLDRVEAVDGWREVVTGTVRVRPVPAGHAPGACGFLVEVGDEDPFHALATGDFTRRDAAGYPGFDPDDYFDVDAVFLTAATNDDFEDDLTETVGTLVQRANEGSTTLCTASGLTGVHLATLLAGVDRELDRSVPVVLAGQVAKLYENLEYEHENVETIPTYSDPTACLRAGAVTVAGPEVPVEGSSARLFEEISDDPNATLVQVQGGNTDAKDGGDARGTVSATAFTNHPPESVLDDVVETIAPAHVVVEHLHGRTNDPYKDKWDVYTWANSDETEQTLYRDGSNVAPPWVGEKTHSRVRTSGRSQTVGAGNGALLDRLSLPDIDRRDRIDLEAEGIDLEHLRERLRTGQPATATATQATPEAGSGGAAGGDQRSAIADGGLYETTGPQAGDGQNVRVTVDTSDEGTSDDLFDTVSSPVTPTAEASSTSDSTGAGETVDESTETPDEVDVSPDVEDDVGGDETVEDESGRNESAESTETDESGERDEAVEGDEPGEQEDSVEETADDESRPADSVEPQGERTAIEIDPVVRSLAVDHADERGEDLDTVVANAVEGLLAAVLRGEDVRLEPDAPALGVDLDPALERVVDRSMADDEERSAFVRRTLCEGLGVDPDVRTLEVADFDALAPLVDAVAENDDTCVEDRDRIVQAALERLVLD